MNRMTLFVLTAALLFSPLGPHPGAAQESEEVTLITGLDGGTYEPYSPSLIEEVQAALKDKGLYEGEVDGQLDEATMEAIGEFQRQNQLTVSGVPSPATRRELLGS